MIIYYVVSLPVREWIFWCPKLGENYVPVCSTMIEVMFKFPPFRIIYNIVSSLRENVWSSLLTYGRNYDIIYSAMGESISSPLTYGRMYNIVSFSMWESISSPLTCGKTYVQVSSSIGETMIESRPFWENFCSSLLCYVIIYNILSSLIGESVPLFSPRGEPMIKSPP